jgi:hypothetical protein
MSKGYKKEYLQKVKEKFNDLQTANNKNNKPTGKSCDDKYSKVCKSNRMDKLG